MENYFAYTRKYKQNYLVILTSNKDLVLQHLRSGYYILINGKKIHPWSTTAPKALLKTAHSFNHFNGITMEKVCQDYIEILDIASPNHASPLEFCSNKELLNQFLLCFKYKAINILETIEKEPLLLPKNRFLKPEDPYESYIDFHQAIKVKKLPLRLKNQEVLFSQREFEILSLLIKGKTMREIAQTLKISPRTVETYLYTAKDKTNTFTTSRLLDLFSDSLF